MPDPDWMTAKELVAVRGGSLRSAQLFIRRAGQRGWCRTSERPSRRGKPTLLLHRGDYRALVDDDTLDLAA